MISNRSEFPQRQQLWQGAVLATIAHAIRIVSHPLLSYELSWDELNYNRQDGQGSRGTITFMPDYLVGVFRDDNSSYAPWHTKREYTISEFFTGIPKEMLLLAHEQALQYVIDEYNGNVGSIITTAFWGVGTNITAAKPWSDVFENGAHLIRIEIMEPEAAIAELKTEYDWGDVEIHLLRSLFFQKATSPSIPITLKAHEWSVFTSKGTEGLDESIALLAAIGITPP